MDRSNRPRSREKRVTDGGRGVYKRGGGLHAGGPVGNSSGYGNRGGSPSAGQEPAGSQRQGGGIEPGGRRGRGMPGIFTILALIVCLFFGGGSFLNGGMSGGTDGESGNTGAGAGNSNAGAEAGSTDHPGTTGSQAGAGGSIFDPWGLGSAPGGWSSADNTGTLDRTVASGSREKRTVIKGNGQDIVTIMVYMCGTDLESRSGMATSDLNEMAAAAISDKINLLVYTGGCTGWRNQIVSSRTNQIYQIKDGRLTCLVENVGEASMTKPETLTQFIRWCKEHYPANRNELIFWDHGGGSISGFGYDEKYPKTGSMTLTGINQALKNGGVAFDFIGFDACLMATMENALMLSQYGDYMIASEETEPGYGWYYTDWLTRLSSDPSMSTLEIGKQIADDFVRVCTQKGQGDNTTLSLVDLAELETTAPAAFRSFSQSASGLIQKEEYQVVSDARNKAKEFARSSGIDQVDLIHLAENMETEEGRELARVLKGAVKYNRTSSRVTNAYGLSIYFPYKKLSRVDQMVNTYEAIGMEEEYSRCIQEFASLEVAGQAAAGGTGSPLTVLLGGGTSSGSGAAGQDMITQLLSSLMSGNYSEISGLDGSNTAFLNGLSPRALENVAEYAAANQFDASKLIWEEKEGAESGTTALHLTEEQWGLIQTLELNVFFDDGQGYIDLGLDPVFQFDEEGDLVGAYDRTWLAVNGQPVAYYFLEEMGDEEHYSITGRVPALLNGQRVDLILVFDDENPYGFVAGARTNYEEEETETVAKGLTELKPGDRIDFLCDYYGYDGTFLDNYYLGETMTVGQEIEISNVDVGDGEVLASYRLTDIYNRQYWTPPIPKH